MEERKRPELTNDDTKGQGPGVHRKNNNKKIFPHFLGHSFCALIGNAEFWGPKKDDILGSKVRGDPN